MVDLNKLQYVFEGIRSLMCNNTGSMHKLPMGRKILARHIPLFLVIVVANFILTSCMVGPNFESPDPPATNSYTEGKLPIKTASTPIRAGKSQRLINGGQIPRKWWELFHSRELNELIELGIANNPNLDAAFAALRVSQENMTTFFGSALLPAVNGTALAQRERINNSSSATPTKNREIFNLYNASVNVSYTLDIFGANRRQLEALCAQVEYQTFLAEAAYLSLTANIVTAAVTEASLRAQIQATHDLIDLNTKQLDIINKQFKFGGISKTNVLAQETQLAQVKATLPPLENQLSVTRHALAALIGALPSDKLLPNFYLDSITLPAELPVSLPSELTRQRPDIRAAEALMHKASAQIGVSTANLFPNITLTGSYGGQSNSTGDLFKGMSNIWDYSGQLLQPIFRGGSLLAARRSSIAAYDQAAAQYRQTVVQAFQNVADSLRAITDDARTLKARMAAEKSAKESLELVQKQFRLGAVNYIDVMNAEQQYQNSLISRIQAQAARLKDSAALFQALGGGWWNCENK